jgi:hypothetical protein
MCTTSTYVSSRDQGYRFYWYFFTVLLFMVAVGSVLFATHQTHFCNDLDNTRNRACDQTAPVYNQTLCLEEQKRFTEARCEEKIKERHKMEFVFGFFLVIFLAYVVLIGCCYENCRCPFKFGCSEIYQDCFENCWLCRSSCCCSKES